MEEPHRTASGAVIESPLVLTDVVTEDGIVGHGIVFTYNIAALEPTAALVRNLEPLFKGEKVAPRDLELKLAHRFRLLGSKAILMMNLRTHFRTLARYNRIANERLFELCAQLDSVEYKKRRQGSFGSIHGLLNHIFLGDRI
jgi:mandelate racemase